MIPNFERAVRTVFLIELLPQAILYPLSERYENNSINFGFNFILLNNFKVVFCFHPKLVYEN